MAGGLVGVSARPALQHCVRTAGPSAALGMTPGNKFRRAGRDYTLRRLLGLRRDDIWTNLPGER